MVQDVGTRYDVLTGSPVQRSAYVCGRRIAASALQGPASEPTQLFIVLDWQECSMAHASRETTLVRWTDTSLVPRKHRSGGMSQQRFERNHAIAVHHWFKQIEEQLLAILARHDTSAIIVGGPGHTKNTWLAQVRDPRITSLVRLPTHNTGYTDDHQGIRELVACA